MKTIGNNCIKIVVLAFFSGMTTCAKAQLNDVSRLSADGIVSEAFHSLPTGSVRPLGWLQKQLRQNLDGFTGHLDSLVPDLVLQDEIYGKNRITKQMKSKNVGAVGEVGAWQAQFLWWNSETQSNWRDGYLRTAILLNDKKHLQRAKSYVQKILATQDEDGYLGIYDKDLRYSFKDENGELWSKTTLLRGLLAWYDYTKDKKLLVAIKNAVDNVIANYPKDKSQPFFSLKPDAGGLTHGLVFTDVLEKLYQITQNNVYRDYLVFLYRDFSVQNLNEDAQYKKLLDVQLPLKGHGVHTYEHLRPVAAAYYASGDEGLRIALQNFLRKIDNTTTISGAPIGDEFIGGRTADAGTGYEYCSLHELMDSYISLLTKTGKAVYGDKIEALFLNASQGARHPSEATICYLKTDNCYVLTGGKNGDTTDRYQTRYRYSPVHKEAAVCCVPNAGRITPAYIQHAWMVQKDTLVATLFGPCEMVTTIAGQTVTIKESTRYPEDFTIHFDIKTTGQRPFFLKIRKPVWADRVVSSAPYTVIDDYLVIAYNHKARRSITVQFETNPEVKKDRNGDFYFTYGPLVLARSIEATKNVTRQFPVAGLLESTYTPNDLHLYRFTGEKIRKEESNKPIFHTRLFNPQTNRNEQVQLVPMGRTILRQITFKR